MIKDIMSANENVTSNSKEMNILKENFPSCFKEDGSFDIIRFQEFLNDKVDISKEGYELRFLGKNYAKMLASLDTETIIVPDEKHNALPENANSENVYISGDNLDGLKHLLKSYAGQIKCIYIDPPYNTGSDGFVYNDKFNFTVADLVQKLSIDEEQAERILDLTNRGSASHSAWLMFMYPRLQLARDLLSKDGVMFVSIDEHEQSNLKLLCDDVFGENNCLATFIWEKRLNRENRTEVSSRHEYVLCYAKVVNENKRTLGLLPMTEKALKNYGNPDKDSRGLWKSDPAHAQAGHGTASQFYTLIAPNGKKHELPSGRCWVYTESVMQQKIQDGRIWFGKDGNGVPRIKTYLDEKERGLIPETILFAKDVTTNEKAKNDLKELFDGLAVFETPKPVNLVSFLINLCSGNNDTILDFFAGSSTTAHAIFEMNAREPIGTRKFILIQLNEIIEQDKEAYSAGYRTIDEMGIERIVRAAKKIKEENPDTKADLGFKHYTLKEVNRNTLDRLEKFDNSGFVTDTTVYDEFGANTVLTTWLVHDNYGFMNSCEIVDLAGYTSYWCGNHLYFINPNLTEEAIKALIEKYNADGTFNPQNIVLFGYSFNYVEMENLKTNIKILRDSEKNLKINLDIRY